MVSNFYYGVILGIKCILHLMHRLLEVFARAELFDQLEWQAECAERCDLEKLRIVDS